MQFEDINIQELIPQQPPFVVVDALTHYDDVLTRTRLQVVSDNIFVENNALTEAGIIENIAQTCATRMGYINKYILKNEVKLGFIGAIKNFVIDELPKVGDILTTEIEIVSEVFALTLVNAKVEVGGKIIASCEMKISISDINSEINE